MGTEPRKKEPRYWLAGPSGFGTSSDVEFKDEPVKPGDRADWSAARLQNDVIARADALRHRAGLGSWSALARTEDSALGLSGWQVRSIVRGQTWMRLPFATALSEICGEELLVTGTSATDQALEIEKLRAEVEDLKAENSRLSIANADMRRKFGFR